MGDKTGIEWTDATWNPVSGCSKVSQGCKNCYAERIFPRVYGSDTVRYSVRYSPINDQPCYRPRKFTDVQLHSDRLNQPLHWRRPRRIFVNSMSDLFHEDVPDDFIDRVFAVMALAQRHTFQILTKRPQRMLEYLRIIQDDEKDMHGWCDAAVDITGSPCSAGLVEDCDWPLPNVWLGVSVEDQATADERIPLLLQTPAAVRFLSCEPLLGPIDVYGGDPDPRLGGMKAGPGLSLEQYWKADGTGPFPGLDWVIAGGESGPHARPSHPDWFRSLRDQCAAAHMPFFFKQWGEWAPVAYVDAGTGRQMLKLAFGKNECLLGDKESAQNMRRVGKKAAGRLLDGVEHNAFPAKP